MKTNLEKPKNISKKTTPEVSPKALVDEMNKKKPRQGRKHVSYGYTYTAPLQKLVSEKGPSEAKPRRSRKKVEEEPVPELPQLDMRPLDDQEEWDHTKKGKMSRKQWKTQESISVAAEDFEIEEPEISSDNEHLTAEEEDAQLEMIKQHNIETFGTNDQSEIGMILAEKYKNHEIELETVPPNPDFPMDYFDEHAPEIQKTSIQRGEVVHDSPDYSENRRFKKTDPFRGKRKDSKDEPIRNINRGFLNKLKNFWLELKNDTKSIAEELGWDEEAELEKQRLQYEENLKNEALHYGKLTKEAQSLLPQKGSEFVDDGWLGREPRPYSKNEGSHEEEKPFKKAA